MVLNYRITKGSGEEEVEIFLSEYSGQDYYELLNIEHELTCEIVTQDGTSFCDTTLELLHKFERYFDNNEVHYFEDFNVFKVGDYYIYDIEDPDSLIGKAFKEIEHDDILLYYNIDLRKSGYILPKNRIIEPIFDSIKENGSNESFLDLKIGYKYGVLSDSLYDYLKISPISDEPILVIENFNFSRLYNEAEKAENYIVRIAFVILKDGLYGIIDENGSVILDYQFNSIQEIWIGNQPDEQSKNHFILSKDSKYHLEPIGILSNGDLYFKMNYDLLFSFYPNIIYNLNNDNPFSGRQVHALAVLDYSEDELAEKIVDISDVNSLKEIDIRIKLAGQPATFSFAEGSIRHIFIFQQIHNKVCGVRIVKSLKHGIRSIIDCEVLEVGYDFEYYLVEYNSEIIGLYKKFTSGNIESVYLKFKKDMGLNFSNLMENEDVKHFKLFGD